MKLLAALAPPAARAGRSRRGQAGAERPTCPDALRVIAAAKAAPLKQIDALETYCDGETSIGDWLNALTAGEARRIAWTAGRCELVNNLNPLDTGGELLRAGDPDAQASPRTGATGPRSRSTWKTPRTGNRARSTPSARRSTATTAPTTSASAWTSRSEWRDRFKDAPPPPCKDD